jgi:uncharacterized protein YcbK (DUF882 family)
LIKRLKNSLDCDHSDSRRSFLKGGAALVAATAIGSRPAFAKSLTIAPERMLSFYNLHTGESLKTAYWVEGEYIPQSLTDINHLMRDFRKNEIKPIDLNLLNLLNAITLQLGTSKPIQLISGYRSPSTNASLHAHSSGVAKHSLHMEAKAADIRIPGHDLRELHKVAMAMQGGGVGYYPHSDFVHVDAGRVRYWTGS